MLKTLKTWEMIKEIDEDNTKIFLDTTKEDISEHDRVKLCDGVICWNGEKESPLNIVIGEDENKWEQIRKPVDFMTAVNSENLVMPDCDGGKICGFRPWSSWTLTRDIINGKWLIK